jgi:D-alanine-D-alanine ligase
MPKVGLAYNLIRFQTEQTFPIDYIAELDSIETIQAIADALLSRGHEVILLEADEQFAEKLKEARPEIVFNVAEGLRGECRESHVPAICELMGIPYTGSGVLTLSTCLNKARTNEVLSCHGLSVPPFQVFHTAEDEMRDHLEYPLIVKLLHEGSSMGLSEKSVVHDEKALRQQLDYLIHTYHEPALVQKFILGREFTVGVLGNCNPQVLPITEVTFPDPFGIVTFTFDDEVLPSVRRLRGEDFYLEYKNHTMPHQNTCPAPINEDLAERIRQTTLRAFKALECRDWGRMDLRLGEDGQLYILDLNPIAGIAPGYWLPNSAKAANLDYAAFINSILDHAWERIHTNHRYEK